jgi:hypothetical protein
MKSVRALALTASIVLTTACGSATNADDGHENVSQTESALQSTAEATNVLSKGTGVALELIDDASAVRRGLRDSDCANMKTRLVPRGVFISASFGAGCEIPVLGSVSGAFSMTLVVDLGVIRLDASFDSLTFDGITLTGSARIAASLRRATVTMDLTGVVDGRSTHVVLDGRMVRDTSALGATIDGSGSFQSASADAIELSASGLHVVLGACYADAGTVSLGPSTVELLPSTPADGAVELTLFGHTSSTALPSYGRCPR